MTIVIPSYRRADRLLKNDGTLRYVSDRYKKNTYIAIRAEDKEAYRPVADFFGVSLHVLMTLPEEAKWGHTMDAIMDEFGDRNLVIMDDDLKMTYRPELKVAKWEKMTPLHFDAFMECLASVDNVTPLASGQTRQFSIQHTDEIEYDVRVNQIYSLFMPFFRQHPQFRFSRHSGMPYMSDYYFCLTLLQHGIHNKVFNRFTRDDTPDAPGGCSVFRTAKEHSKAAKMLRDFFPDLVSLYIKDNWDEPRVGVRIKWSKAFNNGATK